MKPIELNCKTLAELNEGNAGNVIDAALDEVCKDLNERGADGEKRLVKIEIEMKQSQEQISIVVKAGTKRPGFVSGQHIARIRKLRGKPVLVFQPDLPGLFPEDPQE